MVEQNVSRANVKVIGFVAICCAVAVVGYLEVHGGASIGFGLELISAANSLQLASWRARTKTGEMPKPQAATVSARASHHQLSLAIDDEGQDPVAISDRYSSRNRDQIVGRGDGALGPSDEGSPSATAVTVNSAAVPYTCDKVAVNGRRFLVVNFIDEQMASALDGLRQIFAFAVHTNRTVVEVGKPSGPSNRITFFLTFPEPNHIMRLL